MVLRDAWLYCEGSRKVLVWQNVFLNRLIMIMEAAIWIGVDRIPPVAK